MRRVAVLLASAVCAEAAWAQWKAWVSAVRSIDFPGSGYVMCHTLFSKPKWRYQVKISSFGLAGSAAWSAEIQNDGSDSTGGDDTTRTGTWVETTGTLQASDYIEVHMEGWEELLGGRNPYCEQSSKRVFILTAATGSTSLNSGPSAAAIIPQDPGEHHYVTVTWRWVPVNCKGGTGVVGADTSCDDVPPGGSCKAKCTSLYVYNEAMYDCDAKNKDEANKVSDRGTPLVCTLLPTVSPTMRPTLSPTRHPLPPTAPPTQNPSASPTTAPTRYPSLPPTTSPSQSPIPPSAPSRSPVWPPTQNPSVSPTVSPSVSPTVAPSTRPSVSPTGAPTHDPTGSPTGAPSWHPTTAPSDRPSMRPTGTPTNQPTVSPSQGPSASPTRGPTADPTGSPTGAPSRHPTANPSERPTMHPTGAPTNPPTVSPSSNPSAPPSQSPTVQPTANPTRSPVWPPTAAPTATPSGAPTAAPTASPIGPTVSPTVAPSVSPSASPSVGPSPSPSAVPSRAPSAPPSAAPSRAPSSAAPSASPSAAPSQGPSAAPSGTPSAAPSTSAPSAPPTKPPVPSPTAAPSAAPSRAPCTSLPSAGPSSPPSYSPSAAPTGAPRAPTNSPSTQPTGAPATARPSRTPAFPTGAPSASPSAPPSRSPSTAPSTARPSLSPTAAPSRSPSGAPSLPPSPLPSVSPSLPPSLSPSVPPSFGPSSSPTMSPTVSPAAPTTIPSGPPTIIPPSGSPTSPPGPTTAPSTAPTAPPSGLGGSLGDAEEDARAAAEGAVTTGVIVSLSLISSAGVGAAGRFQAMTTVCERRGGSIDADTRRSTKLSRTIHPTGVDIGAFSFPIQAGCVIFNHAIAWGLMFLCYGMSRIIRAALGKSRWEAEGMLRFPAGATLGSTFLSQGASIAGMTMVRYGENFGDVSVGLLAGAWALAMPGLVHLAGGVSFGQALYKWDLEGREGFWRTMFGPGEWVSVVRMRVERWGTTFREALPGYSWVLALDLFLAAVASIVTGLAGGSCESCGITRIIHALLGLPMIVVVFWKCPYARPPRGPLTVTGQVLLCVSSIFLAYGYFHADCDKGVTPLPGHAIAYPLLAAGGVTSLLTALVAGAAALRGAYQKRRGKLQTEMHSTFEHFDKDGSGTLDKDELRSGLEALWGRKPPQDEFDRLWAKLDQNNNGTVDINEYIANEHLFWKASLQGPLVSHGDVVGPSTPHDGETSMEHLSFHNGSTLSPISVPRNFLSPAPTPAAGALATSPSERAGRRRRKAAGGDAPLGSSTSGGRQSFIPGIPLAQSRIGSMRSRQRSRHRGSNFSLLPDAPAPPVTGGALVEVGDIHLAEVDQLSLFDPFSPGGSSAGAARSAQLDAICPGPLGSFGTVAVLKTTQRSPSEYSFGSRGRQRTAESPRRKQRRPPQREGSIDPMSRTVTEGPTVLLSPEQDHLKQRRRSAQDLPLLMEMESKPTRAGSRLFVAKGPLQ
eukprot:TRINITY_DN26126_c0_g1_i1.p1 TRINITY_DN26126_c0_g1~~TRINITY_DN26126_c0_g1_i1.p1  ORF type:complete len:1491 (+),score=206.42 TRINITY_DN26126_c0_g1_i1:85-4473(+)